METHYRQILAYHIVRTTYGTWLPGDSRGWVQKGTPRAQAPDPYVVQLARETMVESAVLLTPEQRALVEQTIRDHCRIRGWHLYAVNVRSNHIHVIVSADRKPNELRNQLKAWCSRKLSDAASLDMAVAKYAGRRRWFTEGGNVEAIEDEEYLGNAVRYVLDGQ